MNRSIIIYMLGWIMNIEAVLLFLPIITAAVSRESVITFYLAVSCICGVLGFLCTRKRRLCTGVLRLDCTQLFWLYALLAQRRNSSFY